MKFNSIDQLFSFLERKKAYDLRKSDGSYYLPFKSNDFNKLPKSIKTRYHHIVKRSLRFKFKDLLKQLFDGKINVNTYNKHMDSFFLRRRKHGKSPPLIKIQLMDKTIGWHLDKII